MAGTSVLAGKRVLVCEDEGVIQIQICRVLSQAGLEVIGSALNGKHGVEMALKERPDIVLMDLNLPVIDGMEAARRIMVAYGPCIVIVSSYGDADLRKRAQEIGVCGYIVKPFDRTNLLPPLEAAYEVHTARNSA